MGDPKGFLKTAKQIAPYREVCERVLDYKHVSGMRSDRQSQEQASRCMDCATPFCHWGCPIGNYIPEWNDYMFRGRWDKALKLLSVNNNIPEITGRVCPAACEYACVLGINDDAVTIRENELAIVEYGFEHSIIKPRRIKNRTSKKIAVVGSGPAGLTAADQLNQAGHNVTVFETDPKPGGILRYGIPDFKLEKHLLSRRIGIWEKEGISFKCGTKVGKDYPADELLSAFDAVLLAGGSRAPRDLAVEGRRLKGIYFAMDYLTQSNRRMAGEKIPKADLIDAKGNKVVVIGGGDTGSDCVGTANRQGASCVIQIEVLPRPSERRTADCPWPKYPMVLKTTSCHEEGCQRHWAITTQRFEGEGGYVKKMCCSSPQGEFEIEADMVILAVGFLHPEHDGLLKELGVAFDERGNIKTDNGYKTSIEKVFAAGDARRGQSLVVWAVSEGRRAAYFIDKHLTGNSALPLI